MHFADHIWALQSDCHPECLPSEDTCGPTEYDCQSCLHFSLRTNENRTRCVPYCPVGYFSNDMDKICLKCNPSCLECDGPKETHCKSCSNKLLKLDTNECVDECPVKQGYFKTKDYECKLCDSNCLECEIEEDFCRKCAQNFTNVNNFCVPSSSTSCESSTYLQRYTNECESCDINCLECTGPHLDECIKCPHERPFVQKRQCVRTCSDGFYLNETASRCFECNSQCEHCAHNSTNCSSCKPGFTLNYKSIDNSCSMIIHYDDKCHETCYECFGPGDDQCRHCKNDLVLHENKCFKQAPQGFYKTKRPNHNGILVNVFEKCDDNCQACTEKSSCTVCEHNYLLASDGKCHKKCTPLEFTNSHGDCSACVEPCLKCSNESYCLSCIKGKYYLNGECISTCPMGYYGQNEQCLPCHWSCEQCSNSSSLSCLTCAKGYSYTKGACRSICPNGAYFDTKTLHCSLCNTTVCLECTKSPSQCIKCKSPLVLDMESFTCKSCCGRNIHGKIKTESCCNCAATNPDNICLKYNDTLTLSEVSLESPTKIMLIEEATASQFLNFASISLIVFSTIICIIALKHLKSVWRRRGSTNKAIRYRPLEGNEDYSLDVDEKVRFDNVFD